MRIDTITHPGARVRHRLARELAEHESTITYHEGELVRLGKFAPDRVRGMVATSARTITRAAKHAKLLRAELEWLDSMTHDLYK